MAYSDPARPSHGSTTTVRAPRTSTTSTLEPFGRGSSDHARKASLDPRTVTNTSPAPRSPRVATISLPTQPIAEASLTIEYCPFDGARCGCFVVFARRRGVALADSYTQ